MAMYITETSPFAKKCSMILRILIVILHLLLLIPINLCILRIYYDHQIDSMITDTHNI